MDTRSALAMLLQRGTRAGYPTEGLPFQRPPQQVGMGGMAAPAAATKPPGNAGPLLNGGPEPNPHLPQGPVDDGSGHVIPVQRPIIDNTTAQIISTLQGQRPQQNEGPIRPVRGPGGAVNMYDRPMGGQLMGAPIRRVR